MCSVAPLGNRTSYAPIPNVCSPAGALPKFGTLIPNRIFVGGIHSTTTEDELRDYFLSFGEVKDVKVIHDKNGLSKGSYGFVTFDKQETAEAIIKNQAETLMFKDRKLNIGYAVRKQFQHPSSKQAELSLSNAIILAHNSCSMTNDMSLVQLCPHSHSVYPVNQQSTVCYPATILLPRSSNMQPTRVNCCPTSSFPSSSHAVSSTPSNNSPTQRATTTMQKPWTPPTMLPQNHPAHLLLDRPATDAYPSCYNSMMGTRLHRDDARQELLQQHSRILLHPSGVVNPQDFHNHHPNIRQYGSDGGVNQQSDQPWSPPNQSSVVMQRDSASDWSVTCDDRSTSSSSTTGGGGTFAGCCTNDGVAGGIWSTSGGHNHWQAMNYSSSLQTEERGSLHNGGTWQRGNGFENQDKLFTDSKGYHPQSSFLPVGFFDTNLPPVHHHLSSAPSINCQSWLQACGRVGTFEKRQCDYCSSTSCSKLAEPTRCHDQPITSIIQPEMNFYQNEAVFADSPPTSSCYPTHLYNTSTSNNTCDRKPDASSTTASTDHLQDQEVAASSSQAKPSDWSRASSVNGLEPLSTVKQQQRSFLQHNEQPVALLESSQLTKSELTTGHTSPLTGATACGDSRGKVGDLGP